MIDLTTKRRKLSAEAELQIKEPALDVFEDNTDSKRLTLASSRNLKLIQK